MRQVIDKETGNELTVTDAWFDRNRRLVTKKPAGETQPKPAKPKAPRKRASSATMTAPAVENTSALPDTNH